MSWGQYGPKDVKGPNNPDDPWGWSTTAPQTSRARAVVQQVWVHPGCSWTHHRSGEFLEVSIPLLQERRRYIFVKFHFEFWANMENVTIFARIKVYWDVRSGKAELASWLFGDGRFRVECYPMSIKYSHVIIIWILFFSQGVFFIPYVLFLFTCGTPLFFLETSLGQFTSQSGVTCWRKICPLFEGESTHH